MTRGALRKMLLTLRLKSLNAAHKYAVLTYWPSLRSLDLLAAHLLQASSATCCRCRAGRRATRAAPCCAS